MSYLNQLKKEFRFHLDSYKANRLMAKDKELFKETGLFMYCGFQGSGKTLSAVKHVHNLILKYPKAILVTNLEIKPPPDLKNKIITFSEFEELHKLLVSVNNDKFGVIYLIDEIHTYFNALESKNIPLYIFTEISQQRKQRKCIIGTSQLFLRMAKPFREQSDYLIMCNTISNIFTINKVYNAKKLTTDYSGELVGKPVKYGWFFHSERLRNMYDTLQKVVSGQAQFEEHNAIQIDKKAIKKGKILSR
ncbi:MAG: ATP-binding protein [bacterium]|nr:ATP-binding protein [bacterium]